MTATLKMIRDDVRARLREPDPRQYLDVELNRYINDGARDLCRRTECIRDRFEIAGVAGTQEYTGPTDLVRIHRVEYEYTDGKVYPLEYRDFSSMDAVWHTSQKTQEGYPAIYTTWGMPPSFKIVLYPTPSLAGTIRCFYYKLPATAVSDSTIIGVPEGWEDAVVTYAESMALRREGNPRWQDSKTQYEEIMADLLVTAVRYSDQAGTIDQWTGAGVPAWLAHGDEWYG